MTLLFSFPDNQPLADSLLASVSLQKGEWEQRNFPDGESYLRLVSDVAGKKAVILCSLDRPDGKIIPLYYLTRLLKDHGCSHITLVAPYLAYMRQDKEFQPGEAVTSNYFAGLLSGMVDELVTIDPHLHRRSSLQEIYSIPCRVLHAAELISVWIRDNIEKPLLIGPDEESRQWVEEVARNSGADFVVMEKVRKGDMDVEIHFGNIDHYKDHNPVLVDDIIATAGTMIETVKHVNAAGLNMPYCIGVHGIFAGDAFQNLYEAGAREIITTNSIPHSSNRIDISPLLLQALL